MLHSVLMTCVFVTVGAGLLALFVLMLDPTNNPYNYRIPPYEAYLSKRAMAIHEQKEYFIKRRQHTILALKMLGVFVIWVIAISQIIGYQVVV